MTQAATPTHQEPVLLPPDRRDYDAMAVMPWEEWLDWEHPGLSDWIDGTAYLQMSNSYEHQRITSFISALLKVFGRWSGLGVTGLGPYAIESRPGRRAGREPDVFFILQEHRDRITSKFFAGAPDAVFEVISEESVNRDRTEKLLEYQELGVPEYWLIDSRPGRETLECYRLREGRYFVVPREDETGSDHVLRSEVLPGFWLRLSWLRDDDPDVLAAFNAIIADPSQAKASE
jgi:Uma2 family endonuclease